ncbi:MAG: contractile injection system tape measure protein [Bacteroidota bacterium]
MSILRGSHDYPNSILYGQTLTNPQVTQSAHLSRSTVLRADKDSANTSTTDSQQEKVPGEASMQRVTEKGSPVTDSSSRFTPTESPEGLWVDHAGIVLLWPFFSRLFETQGWLREESFISSHAQASAMVLLYWLATGEDNPSEAQLLLQKWLVGWPLDEPLLHLTTPQEAAKQEGEKVLLVTLEYWTKMNNSSPEGLRQAYLQRPGQLSAGHPSWTLALESATHDVLLDFLPWGLGVVRLPWLSQTLEIQW